MIVVDVSWGCPFRHISHTGTPSITSHTHKLRTNHGHAEVRFRAKREQPGRSPESQGYNLVVIVLYVPCARDNGNPHVAALLPKMRAEAENDLVQQSGGVPK